MRKVLLALIGLVMLSLAVAVAWMLWGRHAAAVVDQYTTKETHSERIQSVRYEGAGTGGVLRVNDRAFDLTPSGSCPAPSVGSTKEGQLALAMAGKVFAFGPLPKTGDDTSELMATTVPPQDHAQLSLRHSFLPWPTPLDFNFMTGVSPSWKRHVYRRLTWKKPNGATLEMLWRYQQLFIVRNGWTSADLTSDRDHTGLVQIEIKP